MIEVAGQKVSISPEKLNNMETYLNDYKLRAEAFVENSTSTLDKLHSHHNNDRIQSMEDVIAELNGNTPKKTMKALEEELAIAKENKESAVDDFLSVKNKIEAEHPNFYDNWREQKILAGKRKPNNYHELNKIYVEIGLQKLFHNKIIAERDLVFLRRDFDARNSFLNKVAVNFDGKEIKKKVVSLASQTVIEVAGQKVSITPEKLKQFETLLVAKRERGLNLTPHGRNEKRLNAALNYNKRVLEELEDAMVEIRGGTPKKTLAALENELTIAREKYCEIDVQKQKLIDQLSPEVNKLYKELNVQKKLMEDGKDNNYEQLSAKLQDHVKPILDKEEEIEAIFRTSDALRRSITIRNMFLLEGNVYLES